MVRGHVQLLAGGAQDRLSLPHRDPPLARGSGVRGALRGSAEDGLSPARGACAPRRRGGAEAGAGRADRRRPGAAGRAFPDGHVHRAAIAARHRRHLAGLAGGSGAWAKPGRPPKRISFEEAMATVDKKLRALGIRHGIPADWDPPEPAGGGQAG